MKLFGINKKGYDKKDEDAFSKYGFVRLCDSHKKIRVMVNDAEYEFDFVTNFIYEIMSEQIKFAIAIDVCSKKRILFLNKDYIIKNNTTSPYRTFYKDLMKEPFKFCYPFDEEVIIQTKEGNQLKFILLKLEGKSESFKHNGSDSV
ncbi:MAG: hypothetical protein HDT39_12985 [Lachnospiraceae bacterium]|nr:hypothetical protein [Lachnospiraceae bacterium]